MNVIIPQPGLPLGLLQSGGKSVSVTRKLPASQRFPKAPACKNAKQQLANVKKRGISVGKRIDQSKLKKEIISKGINLAE